MEICIKKICLLLLFFLVIFPSINALNIGIEIELEGSVRPGDENFFVYSISADEATKVQYEVRILCPEAPLPFIEYFTETIGPEKPLRKTYEGFAVREEFPKQTCEAVIEVVSPVQVFEKKSFDIDTLPLIQFNIFSCKDLSCGEKSRVFTRGESVFFDFASDIEGISVSGKLVFPGGEEMDLMLPTSLTLDEAGEYLLQAMAEKEGYRAGEASVGIVVLEQQPKTVDKRICNGNGECEPDSGENQNNCPQDCPSTEKTPTPIEKIPVEGLDLSLAIIIAVVILVVIALLYLKRLK